MSAPSEMLRKARAKGRRLEDWLDEAFHEVAAELGKRSRRRWRTLLELVADAQLVDERGERPSKQTVTRTWNRVEQRRRAEERTRAQAPWLRLPVWQQPSPDDRLGDAVAAAASAGSGRPPAAHPPEPDARPPGRTHPTNGTQPPAWKVKFEQARRSAKLDNPATRDLDPPR